MNHLLSSNVDTNTMFLFYVVIFGVIGYFIYTSLQPVEMMMASSEPEHTDTTSAAPGYSPDLNEPPFNPDGTVTPSMCTELDRTVFTERKSSMPDQCLPGQDKIGFLCYDKCPDKWSPHNEFPDSCGRCKDYSDSCDFINMLVQKRTRVGSAVYCKPGLEKVGGLCYEPCPSGYKGESNLCIKCKN